MLNKKKLSVEDRLLNPKEIDEKISELQKLRLLARCNCTDVNKVTRINDFNLLTEAEVFDYKTFYEVSDIKNSTAYYLNGVQVASLFGMNEEYKQQFAAKNTKGQAQLDDKLISFYYREV